MKKLILLSSLLLASCTGSGVTPESVVAEISKDCGIVVQVADIAALIAHQPAVTTIAAFASEVCAAIRSQAPTATPASGGIVVVAGIPIHYSVK